MSARSMLDKLARVPASSGDQRERVGGVAPRSAASRALWILVALAVLSGIAARAVGAGIVALWCFTAAAALVAIVLPLPYALVSPLYMGVLGWVVNMLPFLVLAGWTAAVVRWAIGVLKARRMPGGVRFIWIPIGLAVWTAAGILVISSVDLKHFLLLLGIQLVSSGAVLAVVDSAWTLEDRTRIAAGLVGFALLLSAAVTLQWFGVNIQALQDRSVAARAEVAYGVNSFPNDIGMIKYARSTKGGAPELRKKLETMRKRDPTFPSFAVFRPKFKAFGTDLVVRFAGSARPVERLLRKANVTLIYDNIGLAPGNGVPRMRSFPRNSLTYAGICAALFPLAFYFAWSENQKKRLFGCAGAGACLFGAGFSLARGAWVAIAIAIVYLFVDGVLSGRRKLQVLGAFLAGAVVLSGVYVVKYHVDPLHARAGAEGSVTTRKALYKATVQGVRGIHFVLGFGTEQPRTATGATHVGAHYIPLAGTHSTYLNYLFRTGVPGALAIIVLYALAWLHSRAEARLSLGTERVFAVVVATCVVAAAAHDVILSLYVEPVYTLTVSLLLGIAVAGSARLPGSILPWRTHMAPE